ncbi:hypothetical protein BX070DRAFT_191143, partial [Coemansia spiralis]
YVWKRSGGTSLPRQIEETVEYSGENIKLWDCITYGEVYRIHVIESILDQKQNTNNFECALKGTLQDKEDEPNKMIIQQYNDTRQIASDLTNWLNGGSI